MITTKVMYAVVDTNYKNQIMSVARDEGYAWSFFWQLLGLNNQSRDYWNKEGFKIMKVIVSTREDL